MEASQARGPKTEEERRRFDCAYRRYADELYRFCLRTNHNTAFAEEALSTIFAEAWRRRGEIDFVTKPIRPWLYGVARNVLHNQRRKQRRQEETSTNLARVQRRYAEDPSEELSRREVTFALVGSLRALPKGQRDVATLCLLGDCSYEAAASELKVPVGTVRSRLYRARLSLALAVRGADGSNQQQSERKSCRSSTSAST